VAKRLETVGWIWPENCSVAFIEVCGGSSLTYSQNGGGVRSFFRNVTMDALLRLMRSLFRILPLILLLLLPRSI